MEPRVQANTDESDVDLAMQAKYRAYHRRQYPDNVEQCFRLTLERLRYGLMKDAHVRLTHHEVAILAEAAEALYNIYRDCRDQ